MLFGGVALIEFLQFFEELVCFVASLSQKFGEVVASGLPKRLVGELGRLCVEDGVIRSGQAHVHAADELILGNAGKGIVDEPPQSCWAAALRVIGEESLDDVDICVGRHVLTRSNDALSREFRQSSTQADA